MITMKEQARRFTAILEHIQNEKSACAAGVHIPYDNLSSVWGNFLPGACYSFFGRRETNTLRLWRSNLLWQLVKNSIPVHILEGGRCFDTDTVELLCLQSKVDKTLLHHGMLERKDYENLQLSIKKMALYPLSWETDDSVPPQKEHVVCVKDLSLDEWQEGAETLWTQARQRNVVLLLFVQMPHYVPVEFENLYHPNKMVRPECLSSHLGLVRMEQNTGFPLEKQRLQLCLTLKETAAFRQDFIQFDYNERTHEIVPSSKI